MITAKGRELAHNLEPVLGAPTLEILESLSKLARFAPAYARLQERWCSEEMTDRTTARLESYERDLEARMRRHFEKLPAGLELRFTGDPRGFTVKLRTADPNRRRELRGTDWGGEDVGVG